MVFGKWFLTVHDQEPAPTRLDYLNFSAAKFMRDIQWYSLQLLFVNSIFNVEDLDHDYWKVSVQSWCFVVGIQATTTGLHLRTSKPL